MHCEQDIMGSRGLVPLQGGAEGARCDLERQEAEPPPSLSFLLRGGELLLLDEIRHVDVFSESDILIL
ncbi:hypothetical protein MBAV_001158 [Candidatus Magnetobacterium bavaricum]|uniref:Uncharacterized protein n=1 Tax=Candidatus Magnetobacterium bavaricum TaxID=29290 RepID=A0A0F3GXS9_9BACT|nr:hypothetical protein MBAV_001158 [Candidatus Magnetobacterium bavaricum]